VFLVIPFTVIGTYLQQQNLTPFHILFKLHTNYYSLLYRAENIPGNMCHTPNHGDSTASIPYTSSPVPYVRLCGEISLVGALTTPETIGLLYALWFHGGCLGGGMICQSWGLDM
jgi:hypothetical protein